MTDKPTDYHYWLGRIAASETEACLALNAEFQRLESQVASLTAELADAREIDRVQASMLGPLRDEVASLREALKWYADLRNWKHDRNGNAWDHPNYAVSLCVDDFGDRARAALKATEGGV